MANVKRILIYLLTFLCLNSLWYFGVKFYLHLNNVHLSSEVNAPVKMALQEIHDDIAKGKYDIAEAKLNMLFNDWKSYAEGNSNAGIFSDILYRYKSIATKYE